MPSVGMRRTTRIFGARVLRSGRRVWTGSGERKHMKTTSGEEWIDLIGTSAAGGGGGGGDATDCKENGCQPNDVSGKQGVLDMDIEEKAVESEPNKFVHGGSFMDNRTCIYVYTRKRKKVDSNRFDVSVSREKTSILEEKTSTLEDKKCGKTYSRKLWSRKWTKKPRLCEISQSCNPNMSFGVPQDLEKTLTIVVQSSCSNGYLLACLLNSVLRYLRKSRIELQQLSAFLHSKTIADVYLSCGVHFLRGSKFIPERGLCMIMGAKCFIPMFVLDFSAVPFCFIYLHSCILLRALRLSSILGKHPMGIEVKDDGMVMSCSDSERTYSENLMVGVQEKDDGVVISCSDSKRTHSANVMVTSGIYNSGKTEVSHVNSGAAKLTRRNLQLRIGRSIQKRSSLRSKRGRPPSSLSARKINGALASNLFGFRQDGIRPPSITPNRELRSSAQKNTSTSMKQGKSALVGLPCDVDSTTCFANILVIESDRCYREQGAVITLEVSAKKQWYLAINTEGMKRYSVIAEKFMRPCSCNRFTHAIIWSVDNGWKLEFPDRRDWMIFKELYKECSDRNMQVPVESCIPVPGVHEVPLCVNGSDVFVRPASYITVKDDELNRALTRRAANYDIDSEDEKWISKLNNDFSAENEGQKFLSDEIFELIIDAFERGFHCNPDDYSDEATAPNICLNVERRVLEAVYGYWIKKRKQKRSALVKVFQCYQPRRTQLIPKSVLRKKRSFKRQGSQVGRGKQRSFVHAMAAEHDAEEQQNAILKVDEAKAAANRSEELAVLKRQRAQLLMENADLLTYKATMALRIAELARIAKLHDVDFAQIVELQDAVLPLCSDKQ